ncbi:hypothetical protein NLG97_g11354 [Lecanicillium saksenae]|uniref:Uncharacterized protein n=1 Tax=Lecanicillium saksenae TaxID=468837 RepID=A0ACC1QEG7_9HYPO|nr:hypothetical protein NLG97_g11354 [Lecanicillium saksenae]
MGLLHWDEAGHPRVRPDQAGTQDYGSGKDAVTLDGVRYRSQPMDKLPVGYAKVPMKMLDFPTPGADSQAYLLAGNIGVNRTAAGASGGYASARPMSSWFMVGPVDKSYNVTGSIGSYEELRSITNGMEVQKSCPGYWPPVDAPPEDEE